MKNTKLETLVQKKIELETKHNETIVDLSSKHNEVIEKLDTKIDKLLKPMLDNNKGLQKALKDLEARNDNCTITYDEYGELQAFVTYQFKNELHHDFLNRYLEGYCIDYSNGDDGNYASLQMILDAIVVTIEGDIYQGTTKIIKNSDYQNETDRNILIEKHMEKTGEFPETLIEINDNELKPIKTN